MLNYLLVALGGALGSLARYGASEWVARRFGETFPWGTLLVNVSGSLVIGILAGFTASDARWMASPGFRTFMMVGICGGYTTFSSFSLQTMRLAGDGQWLYAGLNIVGSVALCLIFVWLGHVSASILNR